MSVATGRAELYDALKSLREAWDQVQMRWNDPVARDFGENCWQPVEEQALATVAAMDRLAQVLLQARNDCR